MSGTFCPFGKVRKRGTCFFFGGSALTGAAAGAETVRATFCAAAAARRFASASRYSTVCKAAAAGEGAELPNAPIALCIAR